jgi:uncharacterized membrane protein YtjA (UPF0391 family)
MYGAFGPRSVQTNSRAAFLGATSDFTGGGMLRWALAFFVVALIAAVFGFLGIAAAAAGVARILFFIFLVLFLVSLVGGLVRRA